MQFAHAADLIYSLVRGAITIRTGSRWVITEAMVQESPACRGRAVQQVAHRLSPRRESPPRVGFIMSVRAPVVGMGRELMAHEPVFRRSWSSVTRP